jgi:hypothetical protein
LIFDQSPVSVFTINNGGQPWIALLPTGEVGIGKINPATALDVNGTVTATGFSGDGGGLTNLNATSLGGLASSNLWQLGGNNLAAGQFLGSTNNQPVEIRVNNFRVMQFAYAANAIGISPNVIGGSSANSVAPGIIGATIGGGGTSASSNFVNGNFGTIAGGELNVASNIIATVSGGLGNTASGSGSTVGGGQANISSGTSSTVGGGFGNIASGNEATVAGGQNNNSSDFYSTVAGGLSNSATDFFATVPGGSANTAAGQYAFAAGRQAKALHDGSFVWADSQGADFASTATNQFLIRASGGVGIGTTSPGGALDVRGNIKLGTTGELFGIGGVENLRLLRGRIAGATGNIVEGSGFSAERTAAGIYTITFSNAFTAFPSITVTPLAASVLRLATVNGFNTTSATIRTWNTNSAAIDTDFIFIAAGPR